VHTASLQPAAYEPIPPRYWWLKRIGVAVGVLFVALFALRLWWGWEANRRLQAEIDKIVAAREPIYPEDFDPKEDIPDDQNAARLLIQAESAVNLTGEQAKLVDDFAVRAFELRKRAAGLRGITEPNEKVFDLVHRARLAPGADWGLRLQTPVLNSMFPNLQGQRQLCKLINVAALYHHGTGRDDLAVELLRDAIYQGKIISHQPNQMGQLHVAHTQSITVRTIEVMSSSLQVADPEAVDPSASGSAARQQVERLIQELVDDTWYRFGMTCAVLGERMLVLDTVRQAVEGGISVAAVARFRMVATPPPWIRLSQYAITPLFNLDGLSLLRDSNRSLVASTRPDWQSVNAELPEESREVSFLEILLHPFRGAEFARLHWAFVLHFRALAYRRMAAVALALRLYELDHGNRPDSLADLVPRYLPILPADPYSFNEQEIKYFPRAPRPVLYCVGRDGIDNRGVFTLHLGRLCSDGFDVPFFLNGNRRQKEEDLDAFSPESSQAGDNDDDVADDDRKYQ